MYNVQEKYIFKLERFLFKYTIHVRVIMLTNRNRRGGKVPKVVCTRTKEHFRLYKNKNVT